MNNVNEQPKLTAAEMAVAERKARYFWVSLVVLLLGSQVVIGVFSIYLSLGDPTVAIVPGYHQAALDWDVTHRNRETLKALAWKVDTGVGPVDSESKTRSVLVRVESAGGTPIEGLQLFAEVFHHARGDERAKLKLKELSPGMYAARTSIVREGLWQIDLDLEGDHGLASDSIQLEVM